jgi:hypothetical protein
MLTPQAANSKLVVLCVTNCPVEGYGSIKEALINTLRKASVVQQIAHSAVPW